MSTLDHVRSYYEALNAGDLERKPGGDLLGFDFGTRGFTTIDDWTAPGERRER